MKAALVTLAVALAAACTGASLDPARSSSVEDVPLPAAAKEWGPEGLFQANYKVPGVTYDQLVRWYDAQLPAGRAWRSWRWCEIRRYEREGRNPASVHRIYHVPGTKHILGILIIDAAPPTILITRDTSGPC